MNIDMKKVNEMIQAVDWSQYQTAYGNAMEEEPVVKCSWKDKWFHRKAYQQYKIRKSGFHVNILVCLQNVFSAEEHLAIDAAKRLDAALCHQHVCLYDAALPAYEILLYCLQTTSNTALQEELLTLFFGFAVCTKEIQYTWAMEIRKKLKQDRLVFLKFLNSGTEILAEIARWIVEILDTETTV